MAGDTGDFASSASPLAGTGGGTWVVGETSELESGCAGASTVMEGGNTMAGGLAAGTGAGAVVELMVFSLSRRAVSRRDKEFRCACARASSAAALASFFVLLLLLDLRRDSEELLRFHFWASALVASMIGWQREAGDRDGVHR